MVSVSSVAVAHDLFESRSTLYSDRPELPMMKLYLAMTLPLHPITSHVFVVQNGRRVVLCAHALW